MDILGSKNDQRGQNNFIFSQFFFKTLAKFKHKRAQKIKIHSNIFFTNLGEKEYKKIRKTLPKNAFFGPKAPKIEILTTKKPPNFCFTQTLKFSIFISVHMLLTSLNNFK